MPIYDVAISFAGENRPVAERLASLLVTKGLNVFYDEYEQANLWGKDLYVHLSRVYKDESKFCLMLVSEHYVKKQWTNHERRAAQARAFAENREYILPLRLDDSPVDGVLDTVGFLDHRRTSEETIVDSVVHKVLEYNRENGIAYEIVRVEDVLPTPEGIEPLKDSDLVTTCPACSSEQTLSEATLSVVNGETHYTCINGCSPLVVVGRPGVVAWQGRGFRIGEHVIRNIRDLVATPLINGVRSDLGIRFPGGPAALMKTRPEADPPIAS